ncbi:uncharacterized protein Eint_111055 [Encephalitozoon intestinalis ATCC 50506]|uniref:Uncharacterized protein n=1 Tax=Encephalitozoon intestinalis (strain ATCC 50506) TaxID=876142 RepID=W8PGW0_ENCIT|nr:uncharacterized protein Eint_111055 [Encephalitozoon intestinalis ATCC 50506]AHL30171.1 hypothetical protein Eint_111055 [Encephalitozoon intestinalis ATCC 50506]UTX46463.1 hypothetical protein GPK93_11g20730 [Encephalitozoon intestinalis]
MGFDKTENNSWSFSVSADVRTMNQKADAFFRARQNSNPVVSTKKKILQFAKDSQVDMNKSLIEIEEFPRNAYADELERFPVLKD